MSWDRIIQDWSRLKSKIRGKATQLPEGHLAAVEYRQREDSNSKRYEKRQAHFHWDDWLP
jgi:hypothetical protein